MSPSSPPPADTPASQPYLSPRAVVRRWWLRIHRWLGIGLLIPMALLGFTGSMQVWPEATEALINPQREVAASADPANVSAAHIAAAQAELRAYGGLSQIEIGEIGQPVEARSAPYGPPLMGFGGPVSRKVWLDPASGDAIDSAPSAGGFMWYMHFIHEMLLIPGIGMQVVGWMGIFLVASAITGLVIFWPGTARFFAALKWQKRDGAVLNIHRQSGVLLSLVLIVEAVTGAWIVFPGVIASVIEPGVEQPQRGRPPGMMGGPQGDPVAMPDAAWIAAVERAQTAFPGRLQAIAAPVAADGSWTVTVAGNGAEGSVSVPVADDAPVTVEQHEARREGPPPATTRAGAIGGTMRMVHYARIGGPVWQVIVFLSGLVLTFAALSGIYIWAKRKLRRRRTAG